MSQQEIIDRATKALTKARFQIVTDKRMTFFGVVLMNLKLIPCTHILSEDGKTAQFLPTAATDGRHLFFNPDFVNSLTAPQQKGLVCHEVGHVSGFHHDRQGGREIERWNIATDIKINQGLRDIKIELPPNGQFGDHSHARMTCEQVYQSLPKNAGKGAGGKGGVADPGMCGTMLSPRDENGKPLSGSEARAAAHEQRGMIEEAARMAKSQGSMPQFIERLIQEVDNEPLPWNEILRRFVNHYIRHDYTWRRPSRRMIGQNVYLPSQKTEGTGEVVIGVDTSGSIGADVLSKFTKEIQSIMDDAMPDKIHIMCCDAQVHTFETFERGDEIKFKLMGGGGTAFHPVFQEVEKRGIRPLCLVYLTDLMGSFGSEPDYPVLWACTQDGSVPWGEKVHLNMAG